MDVLLCAVETTKIIDHCCHELKRKVGLEIQTLEGLCRKTSRVCFAEGITAKTLNLPPHFLTKIFRVATFFAVAKVLLL